MGLICLKKKVEKLSNMRHLLSEDYMVHMQISQFSSWLCLVCSQLLFDTVLGHPALWLWGGKSKFIYKLLQYGCRLDLREDFLVMMLLSELLGEFFLKSCTRGLPASLMVLFSGMKTKPPSTSHRAN